MLDTENILWLYEGREMLQQKLFVQHVTKEDKQAMLEYLTQIVQNQQTIENLQRDEKACGFCPYKKYCKAYFKQLKERK